MLKHILTIFIFVSIMILNFTSMAFADDTFYSKYGAVVGTISYDTYSVSCSKEFPLNIKFSNKSLGVVAGISFSLWAHYPDRSTNLITYRKPIYKTEQEKTDDWVYRGIVDDGKPKGYDYVPHGNSWHSGWKSDSIINPLAESGMCYKLPMLSGQDIQPEKLIWKLKINNVSWD